MIAFFPSTSSDPHVKSNGGIAVNVVKRDAEKQDLNISLSHQSSMPSISIADDHKIPDFKVGQFSPSNTMTVTSSSVESFHESKMQDQSTMPTDVIMPTAPAAAVPPHLPEMTRSTLRAYSSYDAV